MKSASPWCRVRGLAGRTGHTGAGVRYLRHRCEDSRRHRRPFRPAGDTGPRGCRHYRRIGAWHRQGRPASGAARGFNLSWPAVNASAAAREQQSMSAGAWPGTWRRWRVCRVRLHSSRNRTLGRRARLGDMPFDLAAMIEPTSCCIAAADQCKTKGGTVVVVGVGPLALLHTVVSKALGARVICVDV